MGQDYRLVKLYEQLYKQQEVQNKEPEKPRSLQEAYKTVLNEKTAFYAKELPETEKTQPDVDGLTSLGTVNQADKIKYLIASQSAKPLVNDLMLAAGNWTNVDNYQEDLLGPVATEFFAAKFTINDIQRLIANKSALASFSDKVKTEQFFDTTQVVVSNLSTVLGGNLDENNLTNLYKYCFTKKCKINDIAVGLGEVALTIFTDCKKGTVGDLDSPTAGAIEVKTDRGRIAKKTQVNTEYKESLIEFLKNQNAKQKVSKGISTLKNEIEERVDQIKQDGRFLKIFTSDYEKFIIDLINNIGTKKFPNIYAASPFKDIVKGRPDTFYQKALQNKFVIAPGEHSSPTPESTKSYVFETHRLLTQIFRDKKLHGQYESLLSASQAITDISKLSTWSAIQYFFFTDFGFTPRQLAEGLLLLVNAKARPKAEEFLPEIESVFNSNFGKSVKAGNMKVLKALIFALQVSVYSKGLFDYLLIISTSAFKGIGFKTGSFKHLFEKFYEHADDIKLDIDLDPDRGGSAITVNPNALVPKEEEKE